ncbi:hypothetical protein L207DRAFT_627905 [Hyaloscypha variabilis F]|uniref:Copper acquisition factor BIM1-like domain-containing protein n=1 Tax=Hyaloscypha variabilis (strain UAMH 11265 / GT02V1 / F) TaxID=1149755 RepID=A0A2J6S8X3_HYAVF|nr:hypothetical protein L207DRAFT_627905 [Hyaloscypha variabilis F]
MASFKLVWLFCLHFTLLERPASAHFIVNTPPPLGNNINNEDIAPCGGFTPSGSDTLTAFHVGGDAIDLTTLHAQSYFDFLGMLGDSLSSNWTFLIPTVEQYGLNGFCEPSVEVPASWAGSNGLLQIIQDSEDGVHYQCMHVNFVASVGSPNSACTNSSGVSAQFATDPNLATVDGQTTTAAATSAVPKTPSSATSSAQTSASTSPSKSAAVPTAMFETFWNWVLLIGFIVISIALLAS